MKRWKKLLHADEGTILTEALIVVPFVTIFAVGILEFGNVFWQRHLLEVGVRDAARYWTRCRPTLSTGQNFMPCTIETARNIAFYGKPTAVASDYLRVPGWYGDASLTITPAVPPASPSADDTVVVYGEVTYAASPLVGMLRLGDVKISFSHEQRYLGW